MRAHDVIIYARRQSKRAWASSCEKVIKVLCHNRPSATVNCYRFERHFAKATK